MATDGPRATLRKAIVSDIDRDSLKQFLGEGTPSRDFDALVTADAAYDKQISELIRRANNEGWIGDLVDAVLKAREGNARFVAAVRPIADQIKKDGELPPDEVPEGRIPTPSPLIWIVLSLLIIAAATASRILSEELPVWLIPGVILALLFLALGIITLVVPRQRLLVDLYAADQRLIPGLGLSGLMLALALVAGGFYAGSAAWPRIVEYATPLPPADKNAALSVLVAKLEDDDRDGSQTKRVEGSLEHALIDPGSRGPRVQVLEAGKTLRRGASSDVHQQREIAEARGREWLKQAGADVLVWGQVVKGDNRIFFLLREGTMRRQPGESYGATTDPGFYLPRQFNEDFGYVIAARLVAAASPAWEEGKFVADLLDQIYPRLEALAANKVISDSPAWCEVKLAMGDVSSVLGEQRGDNKKLQEAIGAYREILANSHCTTDQDFIDRTHDHLATPLLWLGTLEGNPALLEQAVDAYNEALKEGTRERVPLDWATTQNNLGNALMVLGAQEKNSARLEKAVDAYNEALKGLTREHEALDWAMTENNLGLALMALGVQEKNSTRLEKAVAAFNEASTGLMREHVPLDWAMNQLALCNALRALGEQEKNSALLKKAVAACNEALKEPTLEHVPLKWGVAQYSLGLTLAALGEQEKNSAPLEKAVVAFNEALKGLTRARARHHWAATQFNLGNALAKLGEQENNSALLEKAVDAYNEALKVQTREHEPLDWAATQFNLGNALAKLGDQENNSALLEKAVDAYNEALKVQTREHEPLDWAATQFNLGLVLAALGGQETNTSPLKQAVHAFNEALKVQTREHEPLDWAKTQNRLGLTLAALGVLEKNTSPLKQAVDAFNEALKVQTREHEPLDWAETQNSLGLTLAALGKQEQDNARLEEALAAFQENVAIRKELVATDPSNSEWQSALQTGIEAVGDLAYYLVLAHNFSKALDAANEAIALAPNKIWLYTNQAHALMFLGREDEARALYLKYRGTKNVLQEKSWETGILEDFANMRKAGLTNPLMDEIEKQFTAAG